MIHANTIHRDNPRTRSQAGKPALGRCAPSDYHDQFWPEYLPSLPAGGRSRRGRCAIRRQTGAQAGIHRAARFPAISSTRHLFAGWCGSLSELATIRRLIASGLDERVAARIAADQAHQPAVQAFADVPPSVHSSTSSRCSSNASTITGKRFADEQKVFVAGAKND